MASAVSVILEAVTEALRNSDMTVTIVDPRKRVHIGRDDTLPMAVPVYLGGQVRQQVFGDTSGTIDIAIGYRVAIAIIRTGNQLFESHTDLLPEEMENCRQAMYKTSITNATGMYDFTPDPWEVFDEGFFRNNYDYGLIGVEYQVTESRN